MLFLCVTRTGPRLCFRGAISVLVPKGARATAGTLGIAQHIHASWWRFVCCSLRCVALRCVVRCGVQAAATTISEWKFQEVPYPPPTETSQYLDYFLDETGKSLTDWVDNTTIVLFAVTPNAAEGLLKAAMEHVSTSHAAAVPPILPPLRFSHLFRGHLPVSTYQSYRRQGCDCQQEMQREVWRGR